MDNDFRIQEIKNAVDEFWRRLKRWMEDKTASSQMPDEIKQALRLADLTCSGGDIPECCRFICTIAVPRMVEEMRAFINLEPTAFVRNGTTPVPAPRFWAAVRALCQAREGAEAPVIEVLEPVMDLIAQGVSVEQIANHIYGRRGIGPFVQRSGLPDVGLIRQQAEWEKQMRETGTAKIDPVIPKNWIPPWQKQDNSRRKLELEQELASIDRLQNPKRYEDPESIEECIKAGMFVQQVMNVKHVSREVVLETAARIGVFCKDGPGYNGPTQLWSEVETLENAKTEDEDWSSPDKSALRELVIEAYTKANGTKGAAEIRQEIIQAGYEITAHSVSALIHHHKRALREVESASQEALAT